MQLLEAKRQLWVDIQHDCARTPQENTGFGCVGDCAFFFIKALYQCTGQRAKSGVLLTMC